MPVAADVVSHESSARRLSAFPWVVSVCAQAIFAEGKDHPMGIGITKMSTREIRQVNHGIGVELVHYLGDALWKVPHFD